jgi:acyl-CoA thioester hydrolase
LLTRHSHDTLPYQNQKAGAVDGSGSGGTVYPWQCDHVGHMNIMWYVGKFDEANWNLFARIGLTPTYLRESGRGMAAVQQNISYKRELLAGDIVDVRSVLLEIREKSIRFRHDMRNAETGEIAAFCEITGVHMDRQARKSVAFAEAIRRTAAGLIAFPKHAVA